MSDPRLRLKADPRFRRPKKHNSKVVVDECFKGIFDEGGVGKKKLKQNGKGKEKLGALQVLSSIPSHLLSWLQAE
ncbi:hypothetical protein BDR04DRAFT_731159 [Suillus decipiens]|nr:hypothetical protein BDR04DRAFT_731159 [Suillus decipiens]